MTTLIGNHNDLVDEIIFLSTKVNVTKQDFINLLNKYNIGINYDDSMILSIISTGDPVNYEAVRFLLELMADPNLIMDYDILAYETSNIKKLRLDAVFKSFGYKCNWGTLKIGEFMDMEEMATSGKDIRKTL